MNPSILIIGILVFAVGVFYIFGYVFIFHDQDVKTKLAIEYFNDQVKTCDDLNVDNFTYQKIYLEQRGVWFKTLPDTYDHIDKIVKQCLGLK